MTRVRNVFRPARLRAEIDEELASHIAAAAEDGRNPSEAARALGPALRLREESMDARMATWLESLVRDTVFALRQLRRRRVATAAAVVSLALAVGAVTSAFRLIDALLLRPLPVTDPASLYVVNYSIVNADGEPGDGDSFSYPLFRDMREAAADVAALMVVSYPGRIDITFGGDDAMEKAHRQWVSGTYFGLLGLKPAAGRLLTGADDRMPGAHPVAVISHDFWTRRFGRDPKAVGRTFRIGDAVYEIVGVCEPAFTGTEPGTVTELFIPAMQNERSIASSHWNWIRIWARAKNGTPSHRIRQPLQAVLTARRRAEIADWAAGTPQPVIDQYVSSKLSLVPAAAGVSATQKRYRQPLLILGAVVFLVLLIACANVANLLTAQAASREKEMALRVSIGAGRARLVQLMLIECMLMAAAATAAGGIFAWWAAPFVTGMINPPDNPVRLVLPADWRVLGFAALLAVCVTLLFGLAPSLRASAVQPVGALKGGIDPHSRRRLMNALVAAQVAFCFVVHFVTGLFVASYDRLSHQPTGFRSDGVLLLETVARGKDLPADAWNQAAARLRDTPGIESASYASWGLMAGSSMMSSVRVPGRRPDARSPYGLGVSPGWIETMGIELIDGRDLHPEDRASSVGEQRQVTEGRVLVNEAFARKYFDGRNPVGLTFQILGRFNIPVRNTIVGYVRDAKYDRMREEFRPTFYTPFRGGEWGTFVVRRAGGPASAVDALRRAVHEARPELRVSNVAEQSELVARQTLRERLLATLSSFFAGVALLLAAVGLYGVLNYAVVQRRREIGIRIALGARTGDVARHVSAEVFAMLLLGSAIGLGAGLASERLVASLLFEVAGREPLLLLTPLATMLAAAMLAALPPVMRASRTDPANALRAE
ncbi:MAG: ABC transporter permease [Bryobacteraceae bacterium]